MSLNTWQELLVTAQGDGASLSNSAVQTSLLPAAAKITLPAGFWRGIGQELWIAGMCRLSNIVTTPGTLQLDLKLGAVVLWSSGAMQLSTTVHTTLPLRFAAEMTCRAIGATANVMASGEAKGQPLSLTAVADSTTTPATLLAPNVTPAVSANFDSTVAAVLDLFATFSIANVGNLIQLHTYRAGSPN